MRVYVTGRPWLLDDELTIKQHITQVVTSCF